MRRHVPVLAEAFRFYGAFVASVVSLVVLALAPVIGLTAGWGFVLVMLPALLMGLLMGAVYRQVGNGLHARRPWARMAALVLSVLVLGDLPFGLPLGLLGLGVLTDPDVARDFAHPQAPAAAIPSDVVVARRAVAPRQSA